LPEVDILVLSYLESERLIKCVDSVLMSTYPNMKVFIVDNGSGPGVTAKIKDRYSGNAGLPL
jgi:glycosyltransferase involved in cell wall biosynthesis